MKCIIVYAHIVTDVPEIEEYKKYSNIDCLYWENEEEFISQFKKILKTAGMEWKPFFHKYNPTPCLVIQTDDEQRGISIRADYISLISF